MVRHSRLLTLPLAAMIVVGCGAAAATTAVPERTATSAPTEVATQAPTTAPTTAPTEAVTPKPTVAVTPAPAPAGFTLITDASVGYSIAVPKTWLQLSAADAAKLESVWTQLKKDNPDKATLLEASYQAIKNGTMAFLAVDVSGATANMLVEPPQPAASLELLKSALSKQLETQFKLAAGSIKTASVTTPAGPAIQFDYTYSLQSGGKAVTMRVRQYFIAGSKHAYIVSFSSGSAAWAKSEGTFGKIVISLQELP